MSLLEVPFAQIRKPPALLLFLPERIC